MGGESTQPITALAVPNLSKRNTPRTHIVLFLDTTADLAALNTWSASRHSGCIP
jgi:hypothetical protein